MNNLRSSTLGTLDSEVDITQLLGDNPGTGVVLHESVQFQDDGAIGDTLDVLPLVIGVLDHIYLIQAGVVAHEKGQGVEDVLLVVLSHRTPGLALDPAEALCLGEVEHAIGI